MWSVAEGRPGVAPGYGFAEYRGVNSNERIRIAPAASPIGTTAILAGGVEILDQKPFPDVFLNGKRNLYYPGAGPYPAVAAIGILIALGWYVI